MPLRTQRASIGRPEANIPNLYNPDKNAGCNCKIESDCNPVHDLVEAHNFDELRKNYVPCGFAGKFPKYCCPNDEKTTEKPIEVSPRFDDSKPDASKK